MLPILISLWVGFPLALCAGSDDGPNSALTLRLGHDTTISYNLLRMRQAAVWRGGFLDLSQTQHHQYRGEGQPTPEGELLPGLQTWGWVYRDTDTEAASPHPGPRHPLPKDLLDYRGYHVHGERIILDYAIQGRRVLEMPHAMRKEQEDITLVHHLRVAPDGERGEVYCTGFRTPNGLGMLPGDRLTVSDNEGHWMPASKISLVRARPTAGSRPGRAAWASPAVNRVLLGGVLLRA